MQELDRRGARIGRARIAIAAGLGDREAQAGTDAVAAGKHRVAHGRREERWRAGAIGVAQGSVEGGFDAL